MTSHSSLLPVALDAIAIASELVRTRLPGAITPKTDRRDMASEVDLIVEREVRDFLRDKTPAIGFLGEEEGATGRNDELVWTLDPIDGTANFVRGIPLCAVSLGLVDPHRAVLGAIDLPFLDTRYHAAEGEGAYANGKRIRVSSTSNMIDAIVSVGDFAVGPNATEKNQHRLAVTSLLATRAQRVRMFGSAAIDLAFVAHGRTDAVIMLSNKPWDTAAGVILAREAGARIVDQHGADYNLNSEATLATTPALLDDVLTIVRDALTQADLSDHP
jgi:myo-inositol-1(or 4)-monophosphatase